MHIVPRDPDKGYFSCHLWVPKSKVNVDTLKAALTFPIKSRNIEMNFFAWKEAADHLLIPRHLFDLDHMSQQFPIVDVRPQSYPRTGIKSKIVLDAKNPNLTLQRDAAAAMLGSQGGLIQLSCGKGKTVIALDVLATLDVPALVVVDTVQLAEQWIQEINTFLEVPGGVGRLYKGKREWQKNLVVGTYDTVASLAEDPPYGLKRHFGVLIADEAHHAGARTYMPCLDLLPCRRYALTATPDRADGMMPAYLASVGPILYKNLVPDWTPKAVFLKTNIGVNMEDPEDRAQVLDSAQEVHFGLVCSFLGKKPERLALVIDEVRKAIEVGRHILVLSYSVAELVNLYCTYSGIKEKLSDIQQPTAKELGLKHAPNELTKKRYKQLEGQRGHLFKKLRECKNATEKHQYEAALQSIQDRLASHDAAIAVQREYEKRQVDFIKKVVQKNTDAGLLIRRVPVDVRMKMLAEKKVIFAIMKYGREALNQPLIDSVLACEPASQKGGVWQLMGRALRDRPSKKQPIVMFLEDRVGQHIGMCKKIRRFMRENPADEGGPVPYYEFDYRKELNLWRELS